MNRFFVKPEELNKEFIILTGENAEHAKVLRLKMGEEVCVCDGIGNECICTVSDISPGQYSLVVQTTGKSDREPAVSVRIYMALPKADKLEHVIQKATELGAAQIITFPTARCVSKPDEKSLTKKMDRWQKIVVSAAKQCGRGRIPTVSVLKTYKEAVQHALESDVAVLFYENEQQQTFSGVLNQKTYSSISLITGPEGGLEESEVQFAEAAGIHICTLGKRILRCETAPLCALSAVMFHSGEY